MSYEEDEALREHASELFKESNISPSESIGELLYYEAIYRKFVKTGNGVFAMDAFLQCEHHSLQTPEWIRQWLAKGFKDYIKTQDNPNELSNLGKSLGVVTQSNSSQPKPFQKLDNDEQLNGLLHITSLLHHTYSMTVKMAAEVTWHRLDSRSEKRIRPNSHQRLAQIYYEQNYSAKDKVIHQACAEEHSSLLQTFITPEISKEASEYIESMTKKFERLSNEFGPNTMLPQTSYLPLPCQ